MSLGIHLKPKIKKLIAEIHINHPDFGAKRLREELLKQMKERELDKSFGPNWPGVSAVGKVLQEIHLKDMANGDLDKPWSMTTLEKYPFPPEALPHVLKAWVYYQENILNPPDFETRPFSIRVAKWVARLYRIYENSEIEYLTNMAYLYAMDEQAAELAGIDFKRIDFDILLYEMVTGEKVFDNDERLKTIIRGLDLPDDYVEKRTELIRLEDKVLKKKKIHIEDDI